MYAVLFLIEVIFILSQPENGHLFTDLGKRNPHQ